MSTPVPKWDTPTKRFRSAPFTEARRAVPSATLEDRTLLNGTAGDQRALPRFG